MAVVVDNPTPYSEVNDLLRELLTSVRSVLGDHFVGLYLDGSLASGEFDQDSDIDFVVVTDDDISGSLFSALQAMHERLATLDSRWAIQLEGSYVSQRALRRYDPEHALHPNIERGRGEHLKMVYHGEAWTVHRYVLRERGIRLIGPAPQSLIDPVSPDDLRQAMLPLLHGWAEHILHSPNAIQNRGYQSYVVLSLCRILYTLQVGDVVSKPAAARWAKDMLGTHWVSLIDRAWVGRRNPDGNAPSDDVNGTLDFIRYTLNTPPSLPRPHGFGSLGADDSSNASVTDPNHRRSRQSGFSPE
jgi:predicted nucleotidyltransferase